MSGADVLGSKIRFRRDGVCPAPKTLVKNDAFWAINLNRDDSPRQISIARGEPQFARQDLPHCENAAAVLPAH